MKKILTILVFCCALLVVPSTAQAFPPFPSSIYGNVKVNNHNVADGTLVEALINGTIFSQAYTQTYEGESVFSLDIPGDEIGTTPVEGGKEGEIIHFRIGGVIAKETGTWHSGTNIKLDLSGTTSTPVSTPQRTRTPVPTQTAMIIPQTATNQPTLTIPLAIPSEPVPAITTLTKSTPAVTQTPSSSLIEPVQKGDSTPALVKTSVAALQNNRPRPLFVTLTLSVLISLVVVLLLTHWKNRAK